MANQPSGIYTTQQLGEFSLQRIGAFSVNATGADEVELRRTLEWMDLCVALLAETEDCRWLVPVSVTQTLTPNDGAYTLNQFANYPDKGIAHPVAAYISSDSGVTYNRIDLLRRSEWEERANPSTTGGTPDGVYIDRLAENKNVYVHPVQTDSTTVLKLVVQTFAPDVRGGEGNLVGNIDHDFPRAWQMWLIKATAYEISGGPVRKLPRTEREEIKTERDDTLGALIAFQNVEKASQPRRTRRWGFR